MKKDDKVMFHTELWIVQLLCCGRNIGTARSAIHIGENITGGQKTPEKVVKEWMNSEGHKNNFRYSGVGCLHKSKGIYTYYDWVQIFAR